MSYNEIRPVDRSCISYHPGHQTHWIHAKKSMEDQLVMDVVVVVHDDGQIGIEGGGVSIVLWHHDPDRLKSAWDSYERAVWKPRRHMLSVPGISGSAFNMATLEQRSPCVSHPGEATT